MWYSIVAEDIKQSLELRKQTRPAHVERLKALQEQGRLLVAGPNPAVDNDDPADAGFTGSIIIAEFNNLAEAEAWANSDPYLIAGVYQSVTVKPFKKVLP
ncbi:MAG: YciI family protein [Kangiellaceae bacterium]|jgi:uncharacterized protein YciI|nr:YciI family protein [Kangiellaceae bacterium]